MYLSRLVLNARSRLVQQDLVDCQQLHRRIMTMFPDMTGSQARARLGILYRPDRLAGSAVPVVLLQSIPPADFAALPSGYLLDTSPDLENPAATRIDGAYGQLEEGTCLRFRLRANPTKKINTWKGREGYRPNGQRVELRKEEEQLAWLERKADQHGFRLLRASIRPDTVEILNTHSRARVEPIGRVTGRRTNGKGNGGRLTFAAVVYEGLLEIEHLARFREALERGVGPAKAYGFGLLTVMRPASA